MIVIYKLKNTVMRYCYDRTYTIETRLQKQYNIIKSLGFINGRLLLYGDWSVSKRQLARPTDLNWDGEKKYINNRIFNRSVFKLNNNKKYLLAHWYIIIIYWYNIKSSAIVFLVLLHCVVVANKRLYSYCILLFTAPYIYTYIIITITIIMMMVINYYKRQSIFYVGIQFLNAIY